MLLVLDALASPARAKDLLVAGPDDLGLGNGISVADVNGDGDGMYDGWEDERGLEPSADDSAEAPDADGVDDGDEVSAATNPLVVD